MNHEALIEAGERGRVRKGDLANRLSVDRVTLWKYENRPQTAPEGFWERYAAAVDALTAEQREAARAALATA
jgi:hypothetical protein